MITYDFAPCDDLCTPPRKKNITPRIIQISRRIYDSLLNETLRPGIGTSNNTAIPKDNTDPKAPNITMSVRFSEKAYLQADNDVYAKPIDAPIEAISKT